MTQTPTDAIFMQRALELAQNGRGLVSPNPMVGCVIELGGSIIGEGWHQRYGAPHAEVNAVAAVADQTLLSQATVYVTLEPCAHFGKTPPCADLLVRHAVRRVVVCNLDPNPLVAGKGLMRLRDAGIDVETGVLETQGLHLNRRFFKYMTQKLPYIILKWAQSADGFLAKNDRQPLKISNSLSHVLAHKWRTEEDAICVGTSTAQFDNPRLDARLWKGRNPARVVIDRQTRLPQTLNLFDNSQKTIVLTQEISHATLKTLYEQQVQSVLVEGGSQTLQAFIDLGLWDEIRCFQSPTLLGAGVEAPHFKAQQTSQQFVLADTLTTYIPVLGDGAA